MSNCTINLAGSLFGLAALIHLGRIFCPFQVVIGGFSVPEEFSYVGFVLFGLLSVYLFRSRHSCSTSEKKNS